MKSRILMTGLTAMGAVLATTSLLGGCTTGSDEALQSDEVIPLDGGAPATDANRSEVDVPREDDTPRDGGVEDGESPVRAFKPLRVGFLPDTQAESTSSFPSGILPTTGRRPSSRAGRRSLATTERRASSISR